jgi:GTP cyclohydrolase FolE2
MKMIEAMKNIHREHIHSYDRSKIMKRPDEDMCLNMIMRPEFVENLNILR